MSLRSDLETLRAVGVSAETLEDLESALESDGVDVLLSTYIVQAVRQAREAAALTAGEAAIREHGEFVVAEIGKNFSAELVDAELRGMAYGVGQARTFLLVAHSRTEWVSVATVIKLLGEYAEKLEDERQKKLATKKGGGS